MKDSKVFVSYATSVYQREVSRRVSVYAIIFLLVGAVAVGISVYNPWLLTDEEQPLELDNQINFSLVRRFPYTNVFIPDDGAVVSEEVINISGKIRPGMELALNGRMIEIDESGFFSFDYDLEDGDNTLQFEITYNQKRKQVTRTVVYQDPELAAQNTDEDESDSETEQETTADGLPEIMVLKIHAWPETIEVEAQADQREASHQVILHGSSAFWQFRDEITVTASDGSSAFIIINDQEIGPMTLEEGEAKATYDREDGR